MSASTKSTLRTHGAAFQHSGERRKIGPETHSHRPPLHTARTRLCQRISGFRFHECASNHGGRTQSFVVTTLPESPSRAAHSGRANRPPCADDALPPHVAKLERGEGRMAGSPPMTCRRRNEIKAREQPAPVFFEFSIICAQMGFRN